MYIFLVGFTILEQLVSTTSVYKKSSVDDPLIEQINNVKGYIKQARQDLNFEVVETLEMNLRDLQREFYERQRHSSQSITSPQSSN